VKRSLVLKVIAASHIVLFGGLLFAARPQLPPNYPAGLYDENKIPKFTLPRPCVKKSERKSSVQ
jgi:hypothetical protein